MVKWDDEAEWITQSQQGDPEAFGQLVSRYQRMVRSLAFRMTGSVSEAEDLAQDAFVQAYRQLGSFRGEAKFSSWLYRLVVNACLNWQKRNQRRLRLHTEWSQEQEIAAEGLTNSTSDVVSGRVEEALLKLPPKQRAAVVLTTYDQLSHAEVARMLGCSETTVSWRLFAARAKLKSWLKDVRSND